MSRAHEGHSPFSSFLKPFSQLPKRSSQSSSRLNELLNTFENALSERLEELKPKNRSDALNLIWIQQAMEVLSQTHTDLKILITNLEFPVTEWDERWMDEYLDDSIKLLDICNALSANISKLNQDQLLVRYVLHVLDFSGGIPPHDKLSRAKDSLQERIECTKRENEVDLKKKKIQQYVAILQGLTASLELRRAKSSAKGNIFLRVIYGVKATTIFVCGVIASCLSGDLGPMLQLQVPAHLLWSTSFMSLQQEVNEELRSLSKGSLNLLKELESLDTATRQLYAIVEKVCLDKPDESVEAEQMKKAVEELRQSSEILAQGLDPLEKEVNDFFYVILNGRTALLDGLRLSGNPEITKRDDVGNK
eukprot:Gb_09244 [translate_table: standard]